MCIRDRYYALLKVHIFVAMGKFWVGVWEKEVWLTWQLDSLNSIKTCIVCLYLLDVPRLFAVVLVSPSLRFIFVLFYIFLKLKRWPEPWTTNFSYESNPCMRVVLHNHASARAPLKCLVILTWREQVDSFAKTCTRTYTWAAAVWIAAALLSAFAVSSKRNSHRMSPPPPTTQLQWESYFILCTH